ncbi:hypothetical protein L7F22_003264 [Adiantum nelumboides]|nr:hypothetical protein [Adiantum nelumboides]
MKTIILANLAAVAMASMVPIQKRQSLLGNVAGSLGALFPGEKPVVELDYANYRGVTNRQYNTQDFLGMKFAKANRLEESQFIPASEKTGEIIDADRYGDACPQVQIAGNPINFGTAGLAEGLTAAQQILAPPGLVQGQSEDCLHVNVQVPKGVKKGDKLPVIMWIHGGGYELGAANSIGSELTAVPNLIYQGGSLVKRSVEMNKPMVFVSANHRLNFFGTLAGKEISDAGADNLYLKDQRLFMKWVKKYIAEFGGDPDHVVAFGESAGAMSLGCHLMMKPKETEDLIKGAWMFSGGPMSLAGPERVQRVYDDFVRELGCEGQDTLACLKKAPYDEIYRKIQRTPNFLGYTSTEVPWYPRPVASSSLLTESPHKAWQRGDIANIPIVIGDMKDEGTLFSQVNQLNVTTTDDFIKLFRDIYWGETATDENFKTLTELYPDDITRGSPFDTGILNSLTPQYKRIAALTGDSTFERQRRLANEKASLIRNLWSYQIEIDLPLLSRIPLVGPILESLKLTKLPQLGSFHIADVVLHAFGTIPASVSKNSLHIMSTLIAFAHDLDPNTHGLKEIPNWPQYKWGQPAAGREQLLHFTESKVDLINDDFRRPQMQYLNDNAENFLF